MKNNTYYGGKSNEIKENAFFGFLLALVLLSSTAGAAYTNNPDPRSGYEASFNSPNSYQMLVTKVFDVGEGLYVLVSATVNYHIGNGAYYIEEVLPNCVFVDYAGEAVSYNKGNALVYLSGNKELTFMTAGRLNVLQGKVGSIGKMINVAGATAYFGS